MFTFIIFVLNEYILRYSKSYHKSCFFKAKNVLMKFGNFYYMVIMIE